MQAACIGKGGEVFVLDMGEPVSILKLAEDLIKLNGLKPYKDIEIVFTGIRPGEKLFEELLTAEEGTTCTTHEKIFVAKTKEKFKKEQLLEILKTLEDNLDSPVKIKSVLRKYVPYYSVVGTPFIKI